MKKLIILFCFFFSLSFVARVSAQDMDDILPIQESILSMGDDTFNEICYFHHLIKRGRGLSFVVTEVYNSDMTKMIPLVMLADENYSEEHFKLNQIFSVDDAQEVLQYLEFLLSTSEEHPKGIHRAFLGPRGSRIISYDMGKSYKITLSCSEGHVVSISTKRELEQWIENFYKCFERIDEFKK